LRQLFDESIIQLAAGQLVRLPELSSRLSVGDKGSVRLFCASLGSFIYQWFAQDILPSAMGVSSMFSFIMGTNVPGNVDTVVHVEHTVLAVCWLAINQTVSLDTIIHVTTS
jgi:ubiquitin-conjugating enzyme E2 O